MTIQSYLFNKAPGFTGDEQIPVYLGDMNGKHYYAFTEEGEIPEGNETATAQEIEEIKQRSFLIRQIKEEAARRILAIAPTWRQQNATIDLYLLNAKKNI